MANQLILDRALDANGYVAAGAKATVYASGTSTALSVYSDVGAETEAANPIIADGNGFWPQRFVTDAAKVVVTDADDAALYTQDPVPTALGEGSAASEVSFSPTIELPFTNVQDAVEGAAAAAATGYAAFGLGITGNATLLASIDATGTGAGTYRFDGTTTGTYPTGVAAADGGLIEQWRQTASIGMMELHHATTNRRFRRRLTGGAWGSWRENVEVNIGAARGDIIRRGATDWERVTLGASGKILTSDGTDAVWDDVSAAITWESETATSGAGPITLSTTLPSWATEIYLALRGPSLSGSDHFLIQLGTAGSWITASYDAIGTVSGGSSGGTSQTTGAAIFGGSSSRAPVGLVSFFKTNNTNRWFWTVGGHDGVDAALGGGGQVSTTDQPTRVRINATGANTFDAGNIRVGYR